MAMKIETLRTKLAAELGEAFADSLNSVALAWRSTTFPIMWFFAGMAAAHAFGYAFDLNDTVTLAVGCGMGAFAATVAGNRKALNDKEVPGGNRVVLGTTADALVFIALGTWRIANFEVVATVPFSKIASIVAEPRFRRQSLTITLHNGHSMQLDTSQWNDLVPGLAHELLDTAAVPPA